MKLLVALLFTIFNLNIILCKANQQTEQAAKNSELCSQIGIEENAVLNRCGFCTEGETGLDTNYGFDCNHVCNGESVLDCNNQCNGNSFIDVCTGICIRPTENQSIYENRDCSGKCLNSEYNSYNYVKNKCGQCVLRYSTHQNDNISDCGEEVTQINSQDLKNSEQISLNLQNQCNGCEFNDTIDCSYDPDQDLCSCINSSRDCYYMTSINPNVVPNNTPIDINITGYFNGTAKNTYCYLTNERDGTEFAFIAKIISQSFVECNVNLSKVGQYSFSLQKNNSNNNFKLSVYDNELAFYSYMSPKQVLTTDFEKQIDLMFEIKKQISFNFKAILKCKLIYNLNNNWKQTVIIGNNGNSCTIPASDSHSQSQQIVVIPTFDGIHSVSDPFDFSLNIVSPFPRVIVEQSFISEDGLNIMIVFERPVHIYVPKIIMSVQKVCDQYLTNSTLNRLKTFGLIDCKWLSRTQHLISLRNPIDINFIEISIKENTIREYGQRLYQTNDRIDLIVNRNKLKQYYQDHPQLELRGPTIIPLCGAFSLSADFFSPKGSTNVLFKWSVITLPLRNDLISDQLLKTIDSNNKTNVLLFGQMFALESISYKFTISAHLEDRTVIESSIQLFRVTDQLPIVTIFGTTQLNPNQLISLKRQTLYSEVLVPKCIKRPKHLRYQWKTNNPKTKFNFENMTSADYQIDPKYSFEPTIYEINVYSGNDSSMSSTASFTLLPISEDSIIDMSNHISMVAIGQRTGKFKVSANLVDPNKSNTIGFLWSCHYSRTLQPCSLKSDPNKLLITRDIQNRREMTLNSEMMTIGEHVFGLDVIDSNLNISQTFNSFTTVHIFRGKAPKIYIESISVELNDKRIELSLNNSNVITVPSKTHLVVKGVIQKFIQIDSIEWQLSESFIQLGWANRNTRDGIISELHLHPDQISGYGSYNISLKACNGNDVCSQVYSQLIAEPVVNQCVLTIEKTHNREQIAFTTNRCNVPMSRLPLTYQLYEANDTNEMMIPKTRPQFSPVIVIDYSSQLISNGKSYSVEVCDGYGFCQMINTTNTAVVSTDYQNNSQTFDDLIDRSQRYSSIDPISALSQLRISQMTNISDISDENFINDLKVEYLLELKPKHIRHRGDLNLVYHTFGEVFGQTKDFNTKHNLIGTMKTISEKSTVLTDKQTLDYFYTNVLNFYNNFDNLVYHKVNESYGYYKQIDGNKINSYFTDVRHIISEILISCAKQIEIGQLINLGTRVEFPKAVTVMTHQKKFNEIKLITKLNDLRNVSAFVRFQEKANKYYRRITQKNILYNSVVYSVTLFPDESPYTLDSEMHKLSPIVEITVHSPNTGQRLDKEFILSADDKNTFFALMKVTLTGNKTYGGNDYATKCFNFNQNKSSWEMNGVTISGISGSNGGCFITHLSTVIMVRVVQHISTDYIFGVLVAVLMGVLIFGIMVVFFVQKKEQTLNVKPVHRNNSYSDDNYKNSFDYSHNYY